MAAAAAPIVRQEFIDGQPSRLTELRGHTLPAASGLHQVAFQHKQWADPTTLPVEEEADLVIVGAGLSGLAAAHYYRQRFGPQPKVLIIDALEDFGGHAKRNEFEVNGKLLIGYGGSESVQSPKANLGPHGRALLSAIGVDLGKFESTYFLHTLYSSLGLSRASFFDGAKFGGKDVLVKGDPTAWVSDDVAPQHLNAQPLDKFIGAFPMTAETRAQLLELFESKTRVTLAHLPDASAREAYLAKTNYADFLRNDWKLPEEAIAYFAQRGLDFFGLPLNKIAALDATHYGYPGVQGVALAHHSPAPELTEPYVYHFPDGNASIARLLVRKLIPAACPGTTMEDIVLAPVNYAKLDQAESHTRLRLNASVVRVVNGAAHDSVSIGWIKNGEQQVRLCAAVSVSVFVSVHVCVCVCVCA